MTKSTYLSNASSSPTSSRVSRRVSQSEGRPFSSPALAIIVARTLLLSFASLPPFSTMAFPLFTANEAICTSASGRLSKIIAMSPIGQLTLFNIRPSSKRRASKTFPAGSGNARISRMPKRTSSNFFLSNSRRLKSGIANPFCLAAVRSN